MTRAIGYFLFTDGVWVGVLTPALMSFDHGSVVPRFGSPALVALGVVLAVAGAALSIWANAALLGHGGGGTPLPMRPPQRLVTAGPYRCLRNPQAVGMLLLSAGVAVALEGAAIWLLPGLVAGYLAVAVIPAEHKQMEERFGESYDEYRAAVPGWLPRRDRCARGGDTGPRDAP